MSGLIYVRIIHVYYVYARANVYVRSICMSVLWMSGTMCMSVLCLSPYYVYVCTMCMSVLCVCPYYVYVRIMFMSAHMLCTY